MSVAYKRNTAARLLFPARTVGWNDILRMLSGCVTTEGRSIRDTCRIGMMALYGPDQRSNGRS
jgi:hypothetical protein